MQALPVACCTNGHPDRGLGAVLCQGQNGTRETAGSCNDATLSLQVDSLSLGSLYQIPVGGQRL